MRSSSATISTQVRSEGMAHGRLLRFHFVVLRPRLPAWHVGSCKQLSKCFPPLVLVRSTPPCALLWAPCMSAVWPAKHACMGPIGLQRLLGATVVGLDAPSMNSRGWQLQPASLSSLGAGPTQQGRPCSPGQFPGVQEAPAVGFSRFQPDGPRTSTSAATVDTATAANNGARWCPLSWCVCRPSPWLWLCGV